jgi:GTP-binding protein
MTSKTPIVAIVGRANVGKSSLYNAILARREAIVAREAGTTRDSLMAKANWLDQEFWLVDTAGVKDPEDDFEYTIQEQIYQAAESADVIWVMVEADVPITEEDRKLAITALKTKKPVFLVINKIDKVKNKANIDHYNHVGIKDSVLISVSQARGIDSLLDKLVKVIPKITVKQEDPDTLRLAIIGRPNVGKSNLFNSLAKKQQALVSDRAGTTRDINRTIIKYRGKTIELLDTAGIRRPGKIGQGIEHFSVIRTLSAIEQADVCLVLMESNELNVQLDQKIAGLVKEAGKGLVLVVSKWDIVDDKDPYTRDQLAAKIANTYDFVPWAPLIFTSSITGQNVTKIFDLTLEIAESRAKKVSTRELNNWLEKVTLSHPPAGLKNRNPKLNYMVQETDNPTPAFKIFGSSTKFVHWSYRRYMERNLRESFGFVGSPIQLWFIEKHVTHKHGQSPTKEPR